MMHVIEVAHVYDNYSEAGLNCDCGVWKSLAKNDIEIMAKAINHIRNEHSGEGVIEFPTKFIVVTDANIIALER